MARTSGTRLQAVGEDEATLIGEEVVTSTPEVSRGNNRSQAILTGLLFTSLRALSQRTIVALASLVDLALIASAFVLWFQVIASPAPLQLIGVAGYGLFVLVALYMRR